MRYHRSTARAAFALNVYFVFFRCQLWCFFLPGKQKRREPPIFGGFLKKQVANWTPWFGQGKARPTHKRPPRLGGWCQVAVLRASRLWFLCHTVDGCEIVSRSTWKPWLKPERLLVLGNHHSRISEVVDFVHPQWPDRGPLKRRLIFQVHSHRCHASGREGNSTSFIRQVCLKRILWEFEAVSRRRLRCSLPAVS